MRGRHLTLAAALAVALSAAVAQPAAATVETPLSGLGYGDQTARGLNATVAVFIPVSRGVTATGASHLDLELSHSPLLLPDRSTVTVSVNGQAVTSARLDEANRSHGHLQAPLPVLDAPAAGYFVEVQFGMRLTRDSCEDPNNPALWATLHSRSLLMLETATLAGSRDLESVRSLLAPPPYGPSTGITQVVLPTAPTPAQLEAAGTVAWQLGLWSREKHRDPLLSLAHGAPTQSPSVSVGTGSSVDVEAGDQVRVSVGDLAAARSLQTLGLVQASGSRPWAASAASFGQLGFETARATGPGHHLLTAAFERPAGWDLDQGAGLDLVIVTGADIRPETSHLQASVNGILIGDQRLEAGLHHYRFPLPAGELSTTLRGNPVRSLALALDVTLDVPQQSCVPVPPGAASVSLMPESAWYLPHHQSPSADLGRFPAGLAGRIDVVLPNSAGDPEVLAGLQLCAALGRFRDQAVPPPRLIKASGMTNAERSQESLILVGTADRELGKPIAGTTPPEGGADLVLARSPFGAQNSILALHGSESGLLAGAQALARAEVLAQLRGREAIISARGMIDSRLGSEPAEPGPVELTPRIEQSLLERLPIRQLIAVVLLAAVLVAAGLLAYRRYGPSAR